MNLQRLVTVWLALVWDQRPVRIAGAALLAAVIFWIGVAALSWPMRSAASAKERVLADLRRRIATASFSGDVQQAARQASERLDAIDRRLGQQVLQGEISAKLAQIAARAAVTIQSQTYKEGPEQDGFVSLRQELTVQGPYEGVRQFLAGIETQPALTLVRALDMERGTQEARTIRTALQLVTYWRAVAVPPGRR